MKKHFGCVALILFMGYAHAETLEQFFADNPEIQTNTEMRMAIKSQVSNYAFEEANHEGGKNLIERKKQLLNESGGDYARIAIKAYKEYCSGARKVYVTQRVDQEVCQQFLNYKKKNN